MAKIGRNDACPCGSGKKYKHCCLAKDEDAERAAHAARDAADRAARVAAAELWSFDSDEDMDDELTVASNAVVDLVHAGALDEAERAARELLQRFPDMHDGYDRLGMVYQARGEDRQAADCYRKVIDIIRSHKEQYDAEFETVFHKLIEQLDPPIAPPHESQSS
ncbi:SEC-C metal-binding domain-containing protein [Methylosinus sp. PW1]|uniref:SEC-C metal-binding domain-containing protein n=1 Tax=Methylosinus sp. PW1 TaxID=107636 RepID=UPI00056A8C3D|nr:SEC-C metal-binding domain-containing protein [Methylosinus sp. PW1]